MNHRPPVVLPEIAVRPREGWFALLGWILLLVGLGALAGVLFAPNGWYAALLKPTWNPPSWVFGPVWTLLYTIMAVALWLVRRHWLLLFAARAARQQQIAAAPLPH